MISKNLLEFTQRSRRHRDFILFFARAKNKDYNSRFGCSLGILVPVRLLVRGVSEMKIDLGPGYRIYFGMIGRTIVLLLCGGDKKTQDKDIRRALEFFRDHKQREKEDG
jgi:putative addiction module killer protein